MMQLRNAFSTEMIMFVYFLVKIFCTWYWLAMTESKPRVAGVLVGNIQNDPGAKTKYSYFFKAVEEQFPLVEVYDASLRGVYRYLNAMRSFYPDLNRWRESFYKNASAFRLRSRLANRHFKRQPQPVDLIIQVGVLFDVRWHNSGPPSLIYTDYTAHLAAQRPTSGRSPFSWQQRQTWLALERNAFVNASHICTRSQLVRHSIIENYGIAPEKVTAVGGGINFAELPPPRAHAPTDSPTILFIGKEMYRKGGDILLKAFAEARQIVPEARLKMVTADPIPHYLSQEGVEIIPATWERSTIADLYHGADVFVLISRLETWGDVLLEAMSYGLPCIGVTGQAMEEIIEHEVTGLIVPPEDTASLAQSLVRLLTDAELRCRWGKAARLKAEKNYQWTDVVQRLSDSINGIKE
jgi:glycosyltransferase involved in cell wall biosynthesis